MNPQGQIQYFRSRVDGKLWPSAVCATDDDSEPKALLLEVSPGAISNLENCVRLTEGIADTARRHGESCVVLRPTGRGPGSLYQNYGEVDVLEAIEHVCGIYPIDRDRISITGVSMGGAATWYLACHYPDLFAAAAPFCGYCDYRLWEKPGGLTFHMNDWEECSWKSRSAAFLIENLERTPLWIFHGEWDRAVGGGVPVEHSRRMARLLEERGLDHRYTELPKTGHGGRSPEIWDEVVPWLLRQRKERDPKHVSLATYTLRHNRSAWLAVEQLGGYGERSFVEGRIESDGRISVRTENLRTLSIGPVCGASVGSLTIDGQAVPDVGPARRITVQQNGEGHWRAGEFDLTEEKRSGCSGPVADLFFDGVILVPGTMGTEEESFFNNWVASHAAGFYRNRNGGVHRGGIMGENWVDLPVIADADLTEEDRRNRNLILYGTNRSNAILEVCGPDLPVTFGDRGVRLGDRTFEGERTAIFAVFPHPENPERYVAVHGGVSPDAVCWGSHLDMGLLPDYLVYDEGKAMEWGFFGNEWR